MAARHWVILGAILAGAAAVRLWYGPLVRDDAYITLRCVAAIWIVAS
jgi:hypothetical protein